MDENQQRKAFQQLFDAAGKVLEATYTDAQSTRQAIQALSHTRDLVERRLNELHREVTHSVEGAAETTAERTAELLREKFEQADQAADRAAQRYTRAANGLGWKLLALALLMQVAIFVGVWLLVQNTVPSLSEIEARRQEVVQLERQVAALERRGGRLELRDCLDGNKRSHPCFRTDEEKLAGVYQDKGDGKTFRIPWGH
ncbi:hypothetical protein [Ralstonia insidiosa]|uniref:hypothetical protein n=1 Tax=Ralstonia TaxID=48736 RepID=UPI000CEE648A|nr:hypothetical protein [Ralstonia insidiosa]